MTALMLAEPEASVRGFLAQQLTSDGFDVLAFEDPDDLPRSAEPDVLVLGDPESLERCRIGNCAVIVLGREGTTERVRALERCDDYLTRPFAYEELVARIRAVLRRRTPRADLLDLGEIVIDRSARRVLVLGKEIALASKEYALLLRLAQDPDRVMTREQLQRVFNRLVIALVVTGGLIGSSLIGIFAKAGPHFLGVNVISIIGFALSAVLGVWLLYGVVRSGRL